MKAIRRILLASAIGITIYSLSSCKKSNSPSTPAAGTFSLDWNGQAVTMQGGLDTTSNFVFIAAGVLPGHTDTSTFNIEIYNFSQASTWSLKGSYSDTSTVTNTAAFSLIETVTDLAYEDQTASLHPFTIDITTNTGSNIQATFSGMVYLQNGTGPDSLLISNGHLDVNY